MKTAADISFGRLQAEIKKTELQLVIEAGTKGGASKRLLRLADRLHKLCESTGQARRRLTWAAVAEALQGN